MERASPRKPWRPGPQTRRYRQDVAACLRASAGRRPQIPADDDGGPRRDAREEKSGRKRRLEYPPAPEPLPVPVVDNHTHLDFRDGLVRVDVHQAMDAAEAVGVVGAVQVGCDVASARFTIAAIEAEPRLLGAVALHPNDAARLAERGEFEEAFAQIAELARHPRVRAVGETGLDYFRTQDEAGHAAQQETKHGAAPPLVTGSVATKDATPSGTGHP